MIVRVYQSARGFEDRLEKELSRGSKPCGVFEKHGPLYFTSGIEEGFFFWNQNIWLNPLLIEFDSIGEAARALRGVQRNWAPVIFTSFRRAALINEKLPPVAVRPHPFPWLLPDAPMGAFTLLDDHTLLASPVCSSPFPGGIIEFKEDKSGPPSRAYLKLWEALVRSRRWPRPGERCLDAGASPGGWTWALSRLGAEVVAVDRSPLAEQVSALPGVSFIKHDAFTLAPEELGPFDWIFCDVACYPKRLYEWAEKQIAKGVSKNFICTIKLQGETDFETPALFARLPGSMVVHLYHNKHELTWIKLEGEGFKS